MITSNINKNINKETNMINNNNVKSIQIIKKNNFNNLIYPLNMVSSINPDQFKNINLLNPINSINPINPLK